MRQKDLLVAAYLGGFVPYMIGGDWSGLAIYGLLVMFGCVFFEVLER